MELGLDLKQSQTLSAQQLQSMEILRMSVQELFEHIDKVSQENPVIEVGSFDTTYLRSSGAHIDPASLAIASPEGDTLYTHVIDQLQREKLNTQVFIAAKLIASCLDEKGQITESDAELSAHLKIPERLVKEAIEIIWSLEPAGVGARSIGNCIALQLMRFDEDTEIARQIADNYLDRVAKGQSAYIKKELKCTDEQLKDAIRQIRETDPRPCAGFAVQERAQTVIPEIIISRQESGVLSVRVGESYIPPLSLNNEYNDIYKAAEDSELKGYLSVKLREAKWLIGSIERRGETLRHIAAGLVEKQRAFFEGSTKTTAALTMTELADELGVHISTVSRAVAGKYLRCDAGTFPLSHFFSRTLGTTGVLSVRCARERVVSIIDAEDKNKPLSDMAISKIMEESGCNISRRTVAKYRLELGIPPASARKQLR